MSGTCFFPKHKNDKQDQKYRFIGETESTESTEAAGQKFKIQMRAGSPLWCCPCQILLDSVGHRVQRFCTSNLRLWAMLSSSLKTAADDCKLMCPFQLAEESSNTTAEEPWRMTGEIHDLSPSSISSDKWKSRLSTSVTINTATISNINKKCPNVQHLSKANQSKSGRIYDFERSGHGWTILPRHSKSLKYVNHYNPTWWLSGCGSASEMLSLHICAVSAILWHSFCRSESSCTFPWQQQNLGPRNRTCANIFIQLIKWKTNQSNFPDSINCFELHCLLWFLPNRSKQFRRIQVRFSPREATTLALISWPYGLKVWFRKRTKHLWLCEELQQRWHKWPLALPKTAVAWVKALDTRWQSKPGNITANYHNLLWGWVGLSRAEIVTRGHVHKMQ